MRPGLQLAIVADDLTGAMDTAAPFATAGLSTLVSFAAGNTAVPPPQPDVLALSTESRHAAPEIAADRVEAAVRSLIGAAPAMFLKKIDSTLRGNVAAEIAAALRACGRRHVLVAPAAPAQGRTVRAGEVFVHDLALRDTEFAREGPGPAAAIPLPRLLNSREKEFEGHLWTREAPLALAPTEGRHAYVADAETDMDLDRLAEFALAHHQDILLVGSTGIGAALARRLSRNSATNAWRAALQPTRGRILFVVGSRTAVNAEQVARIHATGVQEIVVPAESGALATAMRDEEGLPLLLRPEPGHTARPEEVARTLARAAVEVIRRSPVGSLVIVGGDTASAVFAALAVRDCRLIGEIMPGIPLGRIDVGPTGSLPVVTKSGGFGGPDTLVAIARHLREYTD